MNEATFLEAVAAVRITTDVLADVAEERQKQDEKWGRQDHDPFGWLAILGEEYGEVCKDALGLYFGKQTGLNKERQIKNYRAELIQVAAVAVAMVECLDRNGIADDE